MSEAELRERVVLLLRNVEWSAGGNCNECESCPVCWGGFCPHVGSGKDERAHEPTCELAAVITVLERSE